MIKTLINGVEYKTQYDFTISEQAGNKTASTISVVVEDQPVPVAGDVINLVDSETEKSIFLGTCGIPQSPEYYTGHEVQLYSITCGNANSILAYRIINVAYQDATITEIVQNLFDQYIQAEGVTLGQISDVDVTMEVYTAADFNLQDALNELADLVGGVWMITNDREFVFIVEDDFPKFPRVIDQDFIIGSQYQHRTTDYKTRTVQYVTGATDKTTEQTESYTYDGEQKSFTTVFPLAQKPIILVNNTQVDPDLIGVNGLDDEDPNIVFTFSYNSQTIGYKSNSYLTQGDVVTIRYIGMFPIRVAAYNSTKIAEVAEKTGTSGLREMVYVASDITTTADALQLANSFLERFSEATGEVTFWIKSDELLRAGLTLDDVSLMTQVTFDLPSIKISGDYVITERTITPLTAYMPDGYGTNLKISLRLKNRDYLKSSGEVISNLYRDVSQLFIRQDDIVIQQNVFSETKALSEDVDLAASTPFFPIPQISYGNLFSPISFDGSYYPSAGAVSYSGKTDQDAERYPVSAQDAGIFDPIQIGDVFPTGGTA